MNKDESKEPRISELENPKQFLLRKINSKIEVILKWGQSYEGTLVSTDDYFNILLANATEKVDNEVIGKLNKILIRCNNISVIRETG